MKYVYSKIKLHIPRVKARKYTIKILGYSNYHEIAFDAYLLSKYGTKVFKNGPSKICGRQPLKNLKGYDLLRPIYEQQQYECVIVC